MTARHGRIARCPSDKGIIPDGVSRTVAHHCGLGAGGVPAMAFLDGGGRRRVQARLRGNASRAAGRAPQDPGHQLCRVEPRAGRQPSRRRPPRRAEDERHLGLEAAGRALQRRRGLRLRLGGAAPAGLLPAASRHLHRPRDLGGAGHAGRAQVRATRLRHRQRGRPARRRPDRAALRGRGLRRRLQPHRGAREGTPPRRAHHRAGALLLRRAALPRRRPGDGQVQARLRLAASLRPREARAPARLRVGALLSLHRRAEGVGVARGRQPLPAHPR